MAREYRRAYEQCWYAVPGAGSLALAIKNAGVSFVIVTNNSVEEQQQKLDRCGIAAYVDHLVTSEETGFVKPDARIFHAALDKAGALADAAVMLGDSWDSDVLGARAAGIRAVWFNRFRTPRPDSNVMELFQLEPTERSLDALLTHA